MSVYKTEILFFIWFSIFYLKLVTSEDQVTYIGEHCSDGGKAHQNNLNLLLSNFTSEAVTRKFYNASFGEGPNRIEGIFLCNGGYTAHVCSNCVTVAAGQIQQKCPSDVEAIIWYGQCMLRYSNRSILSIENDSIYRMFEWGPLKYKRFDQELTSTLIGLANTMAVDESRLMYANDVIYVEELIGLVAYVDCTPDITRSDCKKCLQTGLNRLEMNGVQLRTLVQPSCRLAYFYMDLRIDSGDTEVLTMF